jgi:uncharacterized membrane protein
MEKFNFGKWFLIYIQSGFYVAAGLNHFINPEFYLPLIPNWVPLPEFTHLGFGVFEILFGLGLLISSQRKYAGLAIIVMLILLIPSHVFFLLKESCTESLCVPEWIGWVRLIIVHPFLMLWALKAKDIT